MKKRAILLLLAATSMLCSACQCSGGPSSGSAESTQGAGTQSAKEAQLAEASFKLQNGLQADLVSGPCTDAAALVVLFNVGIDHDPPGRSGMARLAGRVLATTAPQGRAERTVETGSDYTMYSVTAAGDKLLEELDEAAAWMAKAAPAEADLAREKARLLEEIGKLSGNDAAATAKSLAEEAVVPTRGNGKRLGIAAEVEKITLAELQAFWEAHFKPGNARIAVAGRFEPDKVRARIEAALGPVAAGTPPVTRDPGDTTVKGTLVMGDAPRAVAVAVPAPPMTDPLYAPFLVLAARLAEKPAQPRTWEASYDPILRPEVLFITGPVGQTEQPEPAAARMRSESATLLVGPPAKEDIVRAREMFSLLVEPQLVSPSLCSKDARAFAAARARRAQLGLDAAALSQALDGVNKEQFDEAAKRFAPKQTASVIAGGAIR